MDDRGISICILLILINQVTVSLQNRCQASAITSEFFKYEHSFNLISVNNTGHNDWCDKLEVKAETLKRCERGRVRLTISSLHPETKVNRYDIKLLSIQNATCESAEGEFSQHSEYSITLDSTNQLSYLNQNIPLLFDYITTGCYKMEITPRGKGFEIRTCPSHRFTLTTDYVMAYIRHPHISSGDMNQRKGYLTMKDVGGLYSAYSVLVRLKNSSFPKPIRCCSPDLHKIKGNNAIPTDHQCQDLINAQYMSSPVPEDEKCNCSWYVTTSHKSVMCYFFDLDPGIYNASIVINDPRCIINGDDEACRFQNSFTIEEGVFPNAHVVPTLTPRSTPFQISTWIWCTALVLIISAVLGLVLIYNKYKNRPTYDVMQPPLALTPVDMKIKILLLYPRDCEQFMKSMAYLRSLLNSTNRFEVYDAFDPAQEEIVSLNVNSWGLNLLTDSSTKVILVASWCSLRIYKSLLYKNSIKYQERGPYDHIFQYHLNHLLEQNHQYKKIYVVRLKCNNMVNLQFEHIAPSRIFTLPEFTKDLVNQLLELPPERNLIFEEESSRDKLIDKLYYAIDDYAKFVDDHPNYLNTIIRDNLITDTQIFDFNI